MNENTEEKEVETEGKGEDKDKEEKNVEERESRGKKIIKEWKVEGKGMKKWVIEKSKRRIKKK